MPVIYVNAPTQNTRVYTNYDGTTFTLTGGTVAWRNNNPGNVVYGNIAIQNGSIGKDANGFAIFPDSHGGNATLNLNGMGDSLPAEAYKLAA